jgi:hypothetical protein
LQEYLTVTEVAQRLKISPKTVRNRMAVGIYREGVHYFSPEVVDKHGRTWRTEARFKWSSMEAWQESKPISAEARAESSDSVSLKQEEKYSSPTLQLIRMAKGYHKKIPVSA